MAEASAVASAAVPAIACGIVGLLVGSFLNVVIHRVPAGVSIVRPRSACPECGSEIRPYDNIPVLSWIALRGRCRDCAGSISARYPLVELGTAVFFAGVALWAATSGAYSLPTLAEPAGVLVLVALLYLAAAGIALALIDLDTHRLPNAIVLPGYCVGVVLLGAAGLAGGDPGALLRAAVGTVALWLGYFAMAIARPGGMGFGDVKLAGLLGMFLGFLGWGPLIVGAFSAFLLGGLFAVVLLIAGKVKRTSGIPFGPWMLAGAWIGIFFGHALWNGYVSFLGLA